MVPLHLEVLENKGEKQFGTAVHFVRLTRFIFFTRARYASQQVVQIRSVAEFFSADWNVFYGRT